MLPGILETLMIPRKKQIANQFEPEQSHARHISHHLRMTAALAPMPTVQDQVQIMALVQDHKKQHLSF